jgi:hypothetical protein
MKANDEGEWLYTMVACSINVLLSIHHKASEMKTHQDDDCPPNAEIEYPILAIALGLGLHVLGTR